MGRPVETTSGHGIAWERGANHHVVGWANHHQTGTARPVGVLARHLGRVLALLRLRPHGKARCDDIFARYRTAVAPRWASEPDTGPAPTPTAREGSLGPRYRPAGRLGGKRWDLRGWKTAYRR
jgi:hypothetical protein